MRALSLALPALLLLGGCQTAAERADNRARDEAAAELAADGRTYGDGAVKTGAAERCINVSNLTNTVVISDRVIDFRVGGQTYRNVLPQACPRLGFERRIIYEVRGGNLCTPELIRVLDATSPIPGPACSLGSFQPVDSPRELGAVN